MIVVVESVLVAFVLETFQLQLEMSQSEIPDPIQSRINQLQNIKLTSSTSLDNTAWNARQRHRGDYLLKQIFAKEIEIEVVSKFPKKETMKEQERLQTLKRTSTSKVVNDDSDADSGDQLLTSFDPPSGDYDE
jgi:hypothetical protein